MVETNITLDQMGQQATLHGIGGAVIMVSSY